jgi:hypothetical protein
MRVIPQQKEHVASQGVAGAAVGADRLCFPLSEAKTLY